MNRVTLGVLVLFLVCLSPLAAQEKPQVEWHFVYEDDVRPGGVAEFESNLKKMIAAFNDKKLDSPYLRFRTFETDDYTYAYLMRLQDLSELPKFNAEWMNAFASLGAAGKAMMESSARTTNSFSANLLMRRPDLSYAPADPRLKPEEYGFIHHDFYYLIPGKELEAEQLAKDFAAAMRKANVRDPFTVWVPATGDDLPLFIVSSPGRTEADWVMARDNNMKALGAEAAALNARIPTVTRKMTSRNLRERRDLSR